MKALCQNLLVIALAIASLQVWASGDTPVLYNFHGNSANDLFGHSVSSAGDVNKDGYDDMIIGASNDNSSDTYSGSAFVRSGKDGMILYTLYSGHSFDGFGSSVSGAGDVNNDGYADVIVGAPWEGNDSKGAAWVFSGKDGTTLYTFYGNNGEDYYGSSVSGAGDVNGDGYADLIVGAPGAEGILTEGYGYPMELINDGLATVLSGMDGSVIYTLHGGEPQVDKQFGESVSGAGDVNGDGYADVIVGAPGWVEGSGQAWVFSGIDGSTLYTFDRGAWYLVHFGISVSGVGDINHDGHADVIVGADRDDANGTDSGSATIFSGMTGSILYTFNGDSTNDWFGYSVSGAGDVNNDGFVDVIVGAYKDDNNGSDSGSARVFSGKDGVILYSYDGDAANEHFGGAVSGAGDVNNDGFADLVVGAANAGFSSTGSARIFSGKGLWTDADGDEQNDAVDSDDDNDSVPDVNDAFPLNAAEQVDTDGDGTGNNADTDDDNDNVIDTNDPFPLDATRWQRVRNNTDFDNDSDILVRATSSGAWTRYSVQNNAIVGNGAMNAPASSDSVYVTQLDANGDGDADILTRSASTGAWTLSIVQGGAVTSSVPLYLYANLDQQFVGSGDFNNDGTDDVMLRSASAGYYTVFLLANHGVNSTVFYNAWTAASSVPQGIGDFNGDGTDDLLVRRTSDNLYFIFKTINGAVDNYYCACNIWANPDWTFQFAGDTNKDGKDDIVIRGTGPTADGKWWAFRMNNFVSSSYSNLNLFLNKTAITVGAVGDYNGDGTIDVLTRVNNSTTYVSPIVNGTVTGNYWLYNFTADQVIGK